jgi:hypothetical protein
MRILHFETGGVPGIAADEGSGWHGLTQWDSEFPGTLPELIAQGTDLLRIITGTPGGVGAARKSPVYICSLEISPKWRSRVWMS